MTTTLLVPTAARPPRGVTVAKGFLAQEFLHDVVVRHLRTNPVFIIGHARSGTSITTTLVRKYLQIGFGTESQFIVRYYRQLRRYGDLREAANLRLLVDDLAGERWFVRVRRRFGFELDRGAVIHDLREPTLRGVLTAVFEQLARHFGMSRWGDKTPEYNLHLPVLDELFPDAQFLHVVRDGRDAALSAYLMHFGDKNVYRTAHEWRRSVMAVRAFAERVPRERFLEIKYEDLLKSPADVFARLITFLGVDDADGSLIRLIAELAPGDLKGDNAGKWRREMPIADQEVFETVAGDLLAQYGYEPLGRRRTITALDRLRWNIENRCRKAGGLEYWHDNLYKARNRGKMATIPLRRLAYRFAGRSTD